MSNEVCGSVGTLEMQAQEMIGIPDWKCSCWEWVGEPGGVVGVNKLDGAVYPPITRGERRGEPNWRKPVEWSKKTVYIAPSDHAAWLLEWERKNNRCSKCMQNKGQEWFGWSVNDGARYRQCRRCGGSGLPPEETNV